MTVVRLDGWVTKMGKMPADAYALIETDIQTAQRHSFRSFFLTTLRMVACLLRKKWVSVRAISVNENSLQVTVHANLAT